MSAVALGIDAGSATCKAVAVDAAGRIVARRLEPASPRVAGALGAALSVIRGME